MRIFEKTARFAAIALAVLFIGASLIGIFGAWFVSRHASDVALKGFGIIEMGVGVIDAGVGRVGELVATSRTEVKQAAETITTIGGQAAANSPVLNALNERLETNLAPRMARMQQALAPVRDALGNVSNAVSLVSSLPGMPSARRGWRRWTKPSTGSKKYPRTRRNCAARYERSWESRRPASRPKPLPRSTGSRSGSTRDWAKCGRMFSRCARKWMRYRRGWTSESRGYCSYSTWLRCCRR